MARPASGPRRVRALVVGLAALALPLATATAVSGHETPEGDLAVAAKRLKPGPAWNAEMQTSNFTVVGHSDLGGGGLNADVWVHRGYAYVGVWRGTCPASGVKVVDTRNPHNPNVVARLQNPKGTSAEDVTVREVRTPSFTGALAVVGIQPCSDPAGSTVFRGLQFWDVTKPATPQLLSTWAAPYIGCHEVDLVQRADHKVFAGCASAFAEPGAGADEVVVVDATNPMQPRKAGGFALGKDKGIDPVDNPQNVGCFKASFAHSVRFARGGRTLFASYWDHGTMKFDVGDTGRVHPVTRSDVAPPDEDADNHSMTLARRGTVMAINLEDWSPLEGCEDKNGWGEVHITTNTRGKNTHLSTFATPNTRTQRTDGFFSVHNTETVRNTEMFSSWYSDGIVWWSLDDPQNPRMKGQFVPPATEDPTGTFPPVPIVWVPTPTPART